MPVSMSPPVSMFKDWVIRGQIDQSKDSTIGPADASPCPGLDVTYRVTYPRVQCRDITGFRHHFGE